MRQLVVLFSTLFFVAFIFVACVNKKVSVVVSDETAVFEVSSSSASVKADSSPANIEEDDDENEKYGRFTPFNRHAHKDSMEFVGTENALFMNDSIVFNVYSYKRNNKTVFHKEDSAGTAVLDSFVEPGEPYVIYGEKQINEKKRLSIRQRGENGTKEFQVLNRNNRIMLEFVVGLPKSSYSYTNGSLKSGYMEVRGDTVVKDSNCYSVFDCLEKPKNDPQDTLSTDTSWFIGKEKVAIKGDSVELMVFQRKVYYYGERINFQKRNKEGSVVIDSTVSPDNRSEVEEFNLISRITRNTSEEGVSQINEFNEFGELVKIYSVSASGDTTFEKIFDDGSGIPFVERKMATKKRPRNEKDSLSTEVWKYTGTETLFVRGDSLKFRVFRKRQLLAGKMHAYTLKETDDGSYSIEEMDYPGGRHYVDETDYVNRRKIDRRDNKNPIFYDFDESGKLKRLFALNYKQDGEGCKTTSACACNNRTIVEVKGDTTFFDTKDERRSMTALRYRRCYSSQKIVVRGDTLVLGTEWTKYPRRDEYVTTIDEYVFGVRIDSIVYPDGSYTIHELSSLTGVYRNRNPDGSGNFTFEDENGNVVEEYVVGLDRDHLYDDEGNLYPQFREVRGDTAFSNIERANEVKKQVEEYGGIFIN